VRLSTLFANQLWGRYIFKNHGIQMQMNNPKFCDYLFTNLGIIFARRQVAGGDKPGPYDLTLRAGVSPPLWYGSYLMLSTGIFDTLQRELGLETSNCTIEMASVGQRTTHRPQRMHFSSSMIMSAPPCQELVPACMGSLFTTRESPSMLMQS